MAMVSGPGWVCDGPTYYALWKEYYQAVRAANSNSGGADGAQEVGSTVVVKGGHSSGYVSSGSCSGGCRTLGIAAPIGATFGCCGTIGVNSEQELGRRSYGVGVGTGTRDIQAATRNDVLGDAPEENGGCTRSVTWRVPSCKEQRVVLCASATRDNNSTDNENAVVRGDDELGFRERASRDVDNIWQEAVQSLADSRMECRDVGVDGRGNRGGSKVVDDTISEIDLNGTVSDNVGHVSERTLANRAKRALKKQRKASRREGFTSVPEWRRNAASTSGTENATDGFPRDKGYIGSFSACSKAIKKELADTRARRFIAENLASEKRALAEVESWNVTQELKEQRTKFQLQKVKQNLDLLSAVDVEKLKKKNEVKLMKETETARVAVEKAFGTLTATGNVAGAFGSSSYESGTVKTVVSGEGSSGVRSGTISPNSSISEAEVRKLQKDFLDVKKSNDEIVSAIKMLRMAADNEDFKDVKAILSRDYQAMYEHSAGFTMDTDLAENRDEEDSGYIDKRGRFHFGIPPPVFEYDFDD